MVYQYVAYNENGRVIKGRLSAASEEAAADSGHHIVQNLQPLVSFVTSVLQNLAYCLVLHLIRLKTECL